MLRAAAQRYRLKTLVQADAHDLPFASGSFDFVLLPESLGYLEAEPAFRRHLLPVSSLDWLCHVIFLAQG